MHAILFALPGRAALVECVKFHDAARQIGVGPGVDLKTKARAADPIDPALLAGGKLFQLAGFRVTALPEDIEHGSGRAFADIDPGYHSGFRYASLLLVVGSVRHVERIG